MKKNNKTLYRPELFSSKKQYPLSGLEGYLGEACSVARQLTKKHTKSFRVRRSNDNAVMDIGFMSNGELDIPTLMNFVGVNSGYVQLLYGCNGSVFACDNTGKEPRIANGGVVDINANNKPNMIFDGSNDALWCSNNTNIDIVNQQLYLGAIFSTSGASAYLICKNTTVSSDIQYATNVGTNMVFYLEGTTNNASTSASNSITPNVQTLHSATWMNNTMQCYSRSVASGTIDTFSNNVTSRDYLVIGARWNSGGQSIFLSGKLSEFYILKGNPKQKDFETKIMKYFNIV
jgi:hypothetical protein